MGAYEVAPASKVAVRVNLMQALYLVIPFCMALVAFDAVFFDFQLRDDYLPTSPTNLLLWAIIFNLPHIVSSFITLADREYLTFYRRKLIGGIAVVVLASVSIMFVIPMLVPDAYALPLVSLYIAVYVAYTMWHVLSQQYGIGMMLMRTPPNRTYQLWRWLSMIAASIMYATAFNPMNLDADAGSSVVNLQFAKILATVFVGLSVAAGWWFVRNASWSSGKAYSISNLAILPATLVMLLLDYPFLVIVIPRFIHDLTAFMIYCVHDQNRNQQTKHNYFYRALTFLPLSPLVLCPVLALIVANSMECGTYLMDLWVGFEVDVPQKCGFSAEVFDGEAKGLPFSMNLSLNILVAFGLFHYYLESFVWKRDSIHRHSVKFQ